jgi:hypothetical protein|tara:strand:+ start:134 stop:283 length:150 start_codon:yes stop_codon:yes gene_type:complete
MISYEDSKEIFGLDENSKVEDMIDKFIADCEIEAAKLEITVDYYIAEFC